MKALLAAPAALLLLGCAGARVDEAALADAAPLGPPTDCVTLSAISETRVRDDRTIDFILRDGTMFRNRLDNSCPGLGFERSFSYETSLPRLCAVDLIRVRTTGGMQGATCGLGAFQQIDTGTR